MSSCSVCTLHDDPRYPQSQCYPYPQQYQNQQPQQPLHREESILNSKELGPTDGSVPASLSTSTSPASSNLEARQSRVCAAVMRPVALGRHEFGGHLDTIVGSLDAVNRCVIRISVTMFTRLIYGHVSSRLAWTHIQTRSVRLTVRNHLHEIPIFLPSITI